MFRIKKNIGFKKISIMLDIHIVSVTLYNVSSESYIHVTYVR